MLPSNFRLRADELSVFCFALDGDVDTVHEHLDALSLDERLRASRGIDEVRRRFIVARSYLRRVLSSYVGVPPLALSFDYGPHGKPSLASHFQQIPFNLSHSDGVALLAVGGNARLGIDIERVSEDVEVDGISRQFFSSAEYAAICNLPPSLRNLAFFKCWTSKEAYVKAAGGGLSIPLNGFEVAVDPRHPACMRHPHYEDRDESWTLYDIEVGDGFVAVLATDAPQRYPTFIRLN